MQSLTPQIVESILKKRFLSDSVSSLKELPLPHTLENLQLIARRIKVAVESGKKIVVVGDYDVDGVVSCAILHYFFKILNYPLEIVIPNRFSDGYGLSPKIIEKLECDLIITVDNGISAIEAAKLCKEKGIELLITDHHTPQENLPDAIICNPKLSKDFIEKEICGACVAWYLCAALKAEFNLSVNLVEFLDLLGLAIVSDVMPLRSLNYVLLKKGLEILRISKRESILLLKEHFKKHCVDEQLISYYIAPLLNSAGRMDSAMCALKFLVAESKAESKAYFEQLLELNATRKAMQNELFIKARDMFLKESEAESLPFVLVWGEGWHEGIIGIIASRLSDEFSRPCIALSKNGEILKGSMRSSSVDCMEVLSTLKEYLLGFGGHFGAAGLSLEVRNLEKFKKNLMEFCIDNKGQNAESQILDSTKSGVLGELSLKFVNLDFYKMLQNYAPYGSGNEIPKFYATAFVESVRIFSDLHSSLCLRDGGVRQNAIVFFNDLGQCRGKRIEIFYTFQWDNYANNILLNIESYKIL